MIGRSYRLTLGVVAYFALTPLVHAQNRPKPQRPVEVPPAVVVLPIDTTEGDSTRTIIQRDFDFGDRIQPVLLDNAVLYDVWHPGERGIDFGPLAGTRATLAVRARRIPTGLHVEVYDVPRGRLRQGADFRLPKVRADRSRPVRDSLNRILGARAGLARRKLITDSVQLDTLARVAERKVPLEHPGQRVAAKRAAAVRDSIAREIERRDILIRAKAGNDTIHFDSVFAAIMLGDSIVRDSVGRELRLAIHGVSDELERWITGTRGIAQTRITYVDGTKLKMIDSDGANDRTLPTVGAALSPSWSPSGKSIVYVDADDLGTRIAQLDLGKMLPRLLPASESGLNIMNITPVYTRDGKNIVWARGGDSPAALYIASATSGDTIAKPFAGRTGFETTSPSFDPDGKQIAFMSPLPLTPQIYIMNVASKRVRLLTPVVAGKRSYRTGADWSPTGEEIAYMQQSGDFQVWTIRVRDRVMRQLTTEGENEDPSWAPDGRHLSITSRRGEVIGAARDIWILDTRTGRMRQLTHTNDGRLSDWSPVLRPNY